MVAHIFTLHLVPIGNRKDDVRLQLHGHVSWQPKHGHSTMVDPKGRAFRCVLGSPFEVYFLRSKILFLTGIVDENEIKLRFLNAIIIAF